MYTNMNHGLLSVRMITDGLDLSRSVDVGHGRTLYRYGYLKLKWHASNECYRLTRVMSKVGMAAFETDAKRYWHDNVTDAEAI